MVVVYQDIQFYDSRKKPRQGFYIDGLLRSNLDFLQRQVKAKFDGVGLIIGSVGSGKTTISHMIARYLDPTFNLDRIVFSGQDLVAQIEKASPGQAIVLDEAIMALASQDFSSDLQKMLVKYFTMIRSKNLYILLIIPNFFLLRKWFAIDRSRFLINCYCPDGLHRGYFKFYSFKKKKLLYIKGYKEMNLTVVAPNFTGRFTNTEGYFIDPDIYESKKQEAIKRLTEDKKTKEEKLKEQFDDYKLKLKIDVQNFKNKWKDKFDELKGKHREDLKKVKEKYKSNVNDIREKAIDLQKSNDKRRILELEQEYCRLLYFFYQWEKDRYEKSQGKEFSQNKFSLLLNNYKVTDQKYLTVRTHLTKGKELIDIR